MFVWDREVNVGRPDNAAPGGGRIRATAPGAAGISGTAAGSRDQQTAAKRRAAG
jgi:hypothetical protein